MNGMEEMDGMKGMVDRAAMARLLAAQFRGEDGHYKRVHVGDGMLAASDGRIMLHVDVPGIQRKEGDGEEVGSLRFGVEKIASEAWRGWPRMGGPEWCQKTLLEAVWPLWKKAAEEAQKKSQESFRQSGRERSDARRTCPHCGEDVFEEDGRLVTDEQWDEWHGDSVYRPVDAQVYLEIALPGKRMCFNAAYLKMALDSALNLGGLQGAFLDADYSEAAVFVGSGWFVFLMPVRLLGVDMDMDWVAIPHVFAEGMEGEKAEKGGEG